MSIRNELLSVLADGRFHTGEELGRCFRISRTAIWKQIQVLKSYDLMIHSVPGRGYRLAEPVELLDKQLIREAMNSDPATGPLQLVVLGLVDSTNRYLMDLRPRDDGIVACIAEGQTAGRGRRGRDWASPYGRNVYLSLLWQVPCGIEALAGFGLAVGVAVHRTVHEAGATQACLKWPNDVVVGTRKLAGTLIEVSSHVSATGKVVIGVGLNVQMPRSAGKSIEQPWIDMHSLVPGPPSRNRLVAALISQLCRAIDEFRQHGMHMFVNYWREYDGLYNRAVSLQDGDLRIEGICRGIDNAGAIMLERNGRITHHHAGDISIRTIPATGRHESVA